MADQNPANPTDPTAPGPAPRALTPAASARAWREPAVRFWWTTGLMLLLIAAYLAVSGVLAWRAETALITRGRAVDAVVEAIDDLAVAGAQRPVVSNIRISYEIDGQLHRAVGAPPAPRALLTIKEKIPIRVDPADPRVWTARTEAMPLGSKFIGPAIALGIMAVTGLIAWLRRQRIARIWRDGAARPAAVVRTGRSGLAPLSHAVDCTLSDTRDKAVYTVHLPQRLGKPQAGETIWLIVHPRWPRHALAAAAFADHRETGAPRAPAAPGAAGADVAS